MQLLTAYPPPSNPSSLSSRGRFNQDSQPVKGSGMKRSLQTAKKVLGPAPRLAETREEGQGPQRAEICAKWRADAW